MNNQSYLQLVSQQPFTAISLAEVKEHLNVIDASTDAYISALLNAAVLYCERRTLLDLRTTTWKLVLDQFPFPFYPWTGYGYYPMFFPGTPYVYSRDMQHRQQLDLKRGAVQSITSIVYHDTLSTTATMSSSDYVLSAPSYLTGKVEPITYWPPSYPRPDSVTITFVSGMLTVPDSIQHAIKLLVGTWFMQREDLSYGPATASGAVGMAVDCLLSQFSVPVV